MMEKKNISVSWYATEQGTFWIDFFKSLLIQILVGLLLCLLTCTLLNVLADEGLGVYHTPFYSLFGVFSTQP